MASSPGCGLQPGGGSRGSGRQHTRFRRPGEAEGSEIVSPNRSPPSSSLRTAPPCRPRLPVDGLPAEPAAAMAAEDPDPPLPPGRSRSTTPIRRLPHNRAATCAGQRVMRHFLRKNAILRRPAPLAFAIAPLTLRMLVTAAAAVLVAAAGETQGPPPCRLTAVPGAVDIAAVAASAENDFSTAGSAVEPAGGLIHRGGRSGRDGPARSRPRGPLRGNALIPSGGDRGPRRVPLNTEAPWERGCPAALVRGSGRHARTGRHQDRAQEDPPQCSGEADSRWTAAASKPLRVSLAAQRVAAARSPSSPVVSGPMRSRHRRRAFTTCATRTPATR